MKQIEDVVRILGALKKAVDVTKKPTPKAKKIECRDCGGPHVTGDQICVKKGRTL